VNGVGDVNLQPLSLRKRAWGSNFLFPKKDSSGGPKRMRRNAELERIRHPRERRVLLLSALANAGIVAGVIAALVLAPDWLAAHHRIQQLAERVRTVAIVAVLILPAVTFLRRSRLALVRENSVRLGRDQMPEIFSILERQCSALGITDPPELHVSKAATSELSNAVSFVDGRQAIVLRADIFKGLEWIEDRSDAIAFVLGYELGRIRLGHASWWQDVYLGYLIRIPVLRLPLLTVETLSRDRHAALLAPDGIRGLILQASGGELLRYVSVGAYVRQVMEGASRWSRLAALARHGPHVSSRVRALYRAGFFHLDRDLARLEQPAAIVH
jgi:hypothetical protein